MAAVSISAIEFTLVMLASGNVVPVNGVPSAAYSRARLIADLKRIRTALMDRRSTKCRRARQELNLVIRIHSITLRRFCRCRPADQIHC